MEKRFACAVVVLLVVCCGGSTSAQSASDLLSIDCGATNSSVDAAGLLWVPDTAYIPTGTNHQGFLPPTDNTFASLTELSSLRAFADNRAKNCYRLPVVKNSTYLLRAAFFYGNYDNAANPPSFQMSIEATIVENIVTSSTGVVYTEILYLSQSNVTYLCLMRDASNGTPFVSSISLRRITAVYDKFDMYLGAFKYMTIRARINFGGSALVRYPDDSYDRYWHPAGATSPYLSPTATFVQALGTNVRIIPSDGFRPPSLVMQSAVTTLGNLTSFYLTPGSTDTYSVAFILLHFAELDTAATNTSRMFYIDVGTGSAPVPMNPYNESGLFERTTWLFWDRTIEPDSKLALFPASVLTLNGPILNGMEVYSVSDARKATTGDGDVAAIEDIKTAMNLSEWTGDPCLPSAYPWVQCSTPNAVLTSPVVTAINLTGYNLTGPISLSFANLLNLTSLSLGNNALTGLLPDLSPLVLLTTLNLESNNLSGPLPDWLTSLPLLQVLTVQNNNFSGTIPAGLLTSSNLQFTSCPGNSLVGRDCKKTVTPSSSKSKSSSLPVIVGAAVGGVVLTLLIIVVGVYIGCRCRRRKANPQQNSGSSGRAVPLKEIGSNSGSPKAFTLAALAAATNNFQKEIGRGGFGPVYHGILPDGKEVAVKVADNPTRPGDQEFYNEVSLLSKLHHRNLTALVGFCQEKKKQILVYEYARDGSLHDQLHGNLKSARPLDWRTRLNIALNAARGLDYLHSNCNPSIIHRDVKSGNILLTGHTEVAKVADFGFSRAGPVQDKTHVSTEVRGTAGYLDPQYFDTQKLTLKSDVFSFGVVLLELITGRLPIDSSVANREDWNLCQYVRSVLGGGGDVDIEPILDPAVRACHPNLEAVWVVTELALRSVEPKAMHRPTMADVLQELQAAIALEEHHASQATPARQQQHPHAPFHERPVAQPDLPSMIFYVPDSMPEPR